VRLFIVKGELSDLHVLQSVTIRVPSVFGCFLVLVLTNEATFETKYLC